MNKNLATAVAIFGAIGGIVALMAFIENRKTNSLREEVLKLDREIKALELSKMRNTQ